MEQKEIENIDMQERKKIFAREMTQVGLALKGEFATISGKKIGHEQHRVSKEIKNLPQKVLSQMKVTPCVVEFVSIGSELLTKLATTADTLSQTDPDLEIAVTNPVIDTPLVKHTAFSSITDVEITRSLIAVPATAKPQKVEIPAKPDIHITAEVPEITAFSLDAPKADIQKICVKVPSTKIVVPQPVQVKKPVVKIAYISAPKAPCVSVPVIQVPPMQAGLTKVSKPFAPTAPKEITKTPIRIPMPEATKVDDNAYSAVANLKLDASKSLAGFEPVHRVSMPTSVKMAALQKQKVTVPAICKTATVKMPESLEVQKPLLPMAPDVQKIQEDFSRTITEFF